MSGYWTPSSSKRFCGHAGPAWKTASSSGLQALIEHGKRRAQRSGVAQANSSNSRVLWWKRDQHVASNSTERKYFNQSILFVYSSSLFHFQFSCPSLFSATSSQTWLLSLQGWRAVPSEHINLMHFHEYQLQAGCQKIFLFSRVETQFYLQTLSQVKSGGVSSQVKPAISFSHSLPPCWQLFAFSL